MEVLLIFLLFCFLFYPVYPAACDPAYPVIFFVYSLSSLRVFMCFVFYSL